VTSGQGRRPRPAGPPDRSQVRWCRHCSMEVSTEVITGWDNLHLVHTYTHTCPYCGRFIDRQERAEER